MRLWIWDGPDPRIAPRTKGPDLARLGELRRRAIEMGADEALLTTSSGIVLEAAYCSLLWWEGDALCMPASSLPILPGVTSRLIRTLARKSGVPVLARKSRALDLHGCETWLVNALHGIRAVNSWVGTSIVAGPASRAEEWQTRLDQCAKRF